MKYVLILLSVFLLSCSEKKENVMVENPANEETEVVMADSTNQQIDKDLKEVDDLLKDLE